MRYAEGVEKYRLMQKAFYSDIAPHDDRGIKERIIGCYDEHQKYPYEHYLLRWLPSWQGPSPASDMTALVFGCGPGRMILRLAPWFQRVDGVDISRPLIEAAHRWTAELPNKPHLFVNDGVSLEDVPSGEYDFVCSVISFHHNACYTIRMMLLAEFFRVLKPGGRLAIQMFYTTQPRHEWPHHTDWREDNFDAPKTNGYHDVRITPENLPQVKEDFESLGFVDFEPVMAPYPPPPHPRESATDWVFLHAVKP